MKELTNYILKFGNLNQQQINFIESKVTRLTLSKNEYFLEAGKIPEEIAFVLDGVLHSFFYNNKGEMITNYFIDENQFVTDYQKFSTNLPSSQYLQALTDCKLLIFSKKDYDEITNTIIVWKKIVSKMYQKCLLDAVDNLNSVASEDVSTRYLVLLKKHPNLANRIPLSYISEYLGISEESLSKIRNKND